MMGVSNRFFGRGTDAGRRAGFTVIELLIVVAIIITLAVLLVATWPLVQERMVRLRCQNNLSKCHKVMCEYGANNNGFLPPVSGSASVGGGVTGWSSIGKGGSGNKNYVALELKDYGGSADIFMCPAWTEYDNENHSYRNGWKTCTGTVYTAGYNIFIGFWPWDFTTGSNPTMSQHHPWLVPDVRKRAFRIDSPDNPPIMCDMMVLSPTQGWGGFYHHPNRDAVVSPSNPAIVYEPGGGGHTLFLSGAVDWYSWGELRDEANAKDHTPATPFWSTQTNPPSSVAPSTQLRAFAGWQPRDDQFVRE
jgi:type II secretory pathway pseudopilin PulG